ncbi:hypothetical protein BKA93DRAFT_110169 [Sparassis latifolia]
MACSRASVAFQIWPVLTGRVTQSLRVNTTTSVTVSAPDSHGTDVHQTQLPSRWIILSRNYVFMASMKFTSINSEFAVHSHKIPDIVLTAVSWVFTAAPSWNSGFRCCRIRRRPQPD